MLSHTHVPEVTARFACSTSYITRDHKAVSADRANKILILLEMKIAHVPVFA
jgi:hypothetical protein